MKLGFKDIDDVYIKKEANSELFSAERETGKKRDDVFGRLAEYRIKILFFS